MPSGKVDKPVIQDNRDGTVSIKYEPKEEGTHELVVKYNGEPVQGINKLTIKIDIFESVMDGGRATMWNTKVAENSVQLNFHESCQRVQDKMQA